MKPLVNAIEYRFSLVDLRSRELLSKLTDSTLYARPREAGNNLSPFSCGEYILRSAAMVEKTFGGITTRMWDDPFEWTLPEKLNNLQLVTAYLDEVTVARTNGFGFFTSDNELSREVPAPENLRPILYILLDTLGLSEHYQGRAFAVFQMLSDEPLPRL